MSNVTLSPEEQANLNQQLLDIFLRAQPENEGERVQPTAVDKLLLQGANPNIREFGDHGRFLAELLLTIEARESAANNIFKEFVKHGLDVNPELDEGSLVMKVHRHLNGTITNICLDEGAPNDVTDDQGRNLLFHTWIPNDYKALIFDYGVDPTHKDDNGLMAYEYRATISAEEMEQGGGHRPRTLVGLEMAAIGFQQLEEGRFDLAFFLQRYREVDAEPDNPPQIGNKARDGFIDIFPGLLRLASEKGLVTKEDLLQEGAVDALRSLLGSQYGSENMCAVFLEIADRDAQPFTFEDFKKLDNEGPLYCENNRESTKLATGKILMQRLMNASPEWPEFFAMCQNLSYNWESAFKDSGIMTEHTLGKIRDAWLEKVIEELSYEDLEQMEPALREDLIRSGHWPMLTLVKRDEQVREGLTR